MAGMQVVLGFDMEPDIGSWTSWYRGFPIGAKKIVAMLKKHNITATFFFTADAAKNNPDIVKLVRDEGHEIGCHTLFHETIGDSLFEIPGMMPVLPEEVEHRLELATEIVTDISGVHPTSFRCPRLFGSTAVVNALERLGYKADATYPMYYFREQLRPYHPSSSDWTKKGDMKIIEIPNFADLSMDSKDQYGRDMDQWPLWRTENAEAVIKHIDGYASYCAERNIDPFYCFYAHPWEFAPMPSGLLHSGEGAVLPDPFIVKNCGDYSAREFDRLISMLLDRGAKFYQAGQLNDIQ
ncbi:MAG: polysaccharide deacetylase family protein [Victivallaceae bacterium]|nr:polysaccharide deacetylase family protein [Victivallaceae bacterium]